MKNQVIRWKYPPTSYDYATETSKRMPCIKVYIASPLGAPTQKQINKNIERAKEYSRFAFDRGFVPWTPHIYFTQFLDEYDEDERAAGIRYGMERMWECAELWAFGRRKSYGMKAEIELAKDLGIPVRYFSENMEEITNGD